jgi:hypothetical protein
MFFYFFAKRVQSMNTSLSSTQVNFTASYFQYSEFIFSSYGDKIIFLCRSKAAARTATKKQQQKQQQ